MCAHNDSFLMHTRNRLQLYSNEQNTTVLHGCHSPTQDPTNSKRVGISYAMI